MVRARTLAHRRKDADGQTERRVRTRLPRASAASVAGRRAATISATSVFCAYERPEIALHEIEEVASVLLVERQIEAQLLADGFHRFGRRAAPGDLPRRIGRKDVEQQEGDEADAHQQEGGLADPAREVADRWTRPSGECAARRGKRATAGTPRHQAQKSRPDFLVPGALAANAAFGRRLGVPAWGPCGRVRSPLCRADPPASGRAPRAAHRPSTLNATAISTIAAPGMNTSHGAVAK